MKRVRYAANAYGYIVQTLEDDQVVDEIHAGNCREDSHAIVDPFDPGSVKPDELKEWAELTARQIADDLHVPAEYTELLESHIFSGDNN